MSDRNVLYDAARQMVAGGNPFRLDIEAIRYTIDILQIKLLDGGVTERACAPAVKRLNELLVDFEQIATDYESRRAK